MKVSYRGRKIKGSEFERKIAKLIKDEGIDERARRMPGSGSFGVGMKGDLITPNIPISWELKNQETWSPIAYYEQALKDRPNGRYIPVVVMGKNNVEPFVFFTFNDFLNILSHALDGGLKEDM